jgi:glycerol uptake facilitator-like aquaporin
MLNSVLAELFGTGILIYSILISGLHPVIIAITLLILIYTFGKISGGHFNPAVSLVFLLKKNINTTKFLYYVLAQFIGATLAFYIYKQTLKINKI